MRAEADRSATTRDGFLGNKIQLIQPKAGHRAGLDAVLLQAMIPAGTSGHLIDLGTGTGAAAMAAAARIGTLSVIGVDFDSRSLDLARQALALPANRAISGRVRFVQGDAAAVRPHREAAGLNDQSADWVIMNPPFDIAGRVQPSPDADRRRAHVGDEATLSGWIRSACGLLKPRGQLAIVHRAEAAGSVLEALKGRFGGIVLLPVHPRRAEPASRVLITAVRDGKAALIIRPGLVLHQADNGWTEQTAAVLAGDAGLNDGFQFPADKG